MSIEHGGFDPQPLPLRPQESLLTLPTILSNGNSTTTAVAVGPHANAQQHSIVLTSVSFEEINDQMGQVADPLSPYAENSPSTLLPAPQQLYSQDDSNSTGRENKNSNASESGGQPTRHKEASFAQVPETASSVSDSRQRGNFPEEDTEMVPIRLYASPTSVASKNVNNMNSEQGSFIKNNDASFSPAALHANNIHNIQAFLATSLTLTGGSTHSSFLANPTRNESYGIKREQTFAVAATTAARGMKAVIVEAKGVCAEDSSVIKGAPPRQSEVPPPIMLSSSVELVEIGDSSPRINATAEILNVGNGDNNYNNDDCEMKVISAGENTLSLPRVETRTTRYQHGHPIYNNLSHYSDTTLEDEGSVSGTYSLLMTTIVVAGVIVGIRIVVQRFTSWDGEMVVKDMSLVFTGLFFILGRMFSTVNSDLKEALRMPMDVCCALDLIEDFFKFAAAKIPNAEEGGGDVRITMRYDAVMMTLLPNEDEEGEELENKRAKDFAALPYEHQNHSITTVGMTLDALRHRKEVTSAYKESQMSKEELREHQEEKAERRRLRQERHAEEDEREMHRIVASSPTSAAKKSTTYNLPEGSSTSLVPMMATVTGSKTSAQHHLLRNASRTTNHYQQSATVEEATKGLRGGNAPPPSSITSLLPSPSASDALIGGGRHHQASPSSSLATTASPYSPATVPAVPQNDQSIGGGANSLLFPANRANINKENGAVAPFTTSVLLPPPPALRQDHQVVLPLSPSRPSAPTPSPSSVRVVTIGLEKGTARLVTIRKLLLAFAKAFHDTCVGPEGRTADEEAARAEKKAQRRAAKKGRANHPSSIVYGASPAAAVDAGYNKERSNSRAISIVSAQHRKLVPDGWLPAGFYGYDNGPQPNSFSECLNILDRINYLSCVWGGDREKIVVRVPRYIDIARRLTGRATVIKRTDVLPAAMALVNYFVLMSCVLMFLATYKTYASLVVGMMCTMVVSLFMVRILQAMDDPFHVKSTSAWRRWLFGHTSAVEMFPIIEYIRRTERLVAVDEVLERLRDEARERWRNQQAKGEKER